MITPYMRRGLLAAFVTCVTIGCEDVPLLPKWDADWFLPIASRGAALSTAFGGTIPVSPLGPVPLSTPVETQQLDDAIGALLDEELRSGSLVFTVTTDIPVDGSASVFVAPSAAELASPGPNRIDAPFTFVSATPSITDTIAITAAGLDMLRATAAAGGTLHIQMRGSVTYNGPAPRTVSATDSLVIQVQCLCRLAVSR